MNARLTEWRKRHLAPLGRRGRMLEVVAISLLTSALSFGVPLMVQCRVGGRRGGYHQWGGLAQVAEGPAALQGGEGGGRR